MKTNKAMRLARMLVLGCGGLLLCAGMSAQEATITAPESIVADGVPKIPASLAETAGRYGAYRTASLADWNPEKREMLIATRFGDTPQLHLVSAPGGERRQLTFYPDAVTNGRFHPNGGDYIVFSKDIGGGEWYQLYRYDLRTGEVTLLTDGKARNLMGPWSSKGDTLAYMSTRRTGKDTDLWVMNPGDPKTDRLLTKLQGGGWQPLDWSPDDSKILLQEELSINESYLWLVDTATGAKTVLTPGDAKEKVSYGGGQFRKDGKGIYVTTDKDSEFHRLAYVDFATKQYKFLTEDILWDVELFDLSKDGQHIAFVANENGISALYVLDPATGKRTRYFEARKFSRSGEPPAADSVVPAVIGAIRWNPDGKEVGFTMQLATMPADCFSFNLAHDVAERWTFSESAVKTEDSPAAALVKWRSFDEREISGFLYRPPAAKFPGKRPVLVVIHGGPEGPSQPVFLGRGNYYLNELGIALIYPNVRGSTGYGKTFSLLDNGFNRENTYRDIAALFDWIGGQTDLDASRICVTGGSYGGHMTLAVSTFYSDRIKCSVDIVGMSNLVTFLEHTEAYRRDLRRVEYGDERDPKMREFLEKIAPMNHIDLIKKPMMVVAGKNDPRVPVSESQQIADALKKEGTPVWFLVGKDEGHGFRKKVNQDFQFYATVEFLKEYLLK